MRSTNWTNNVYLVDFSHETCVGPLNCTYSNWHAEMMLYKNIDTRLYLTMAWRRGVSSGGLLTSGLALIKRRKSRHCR